MVQISWQHIRSLHSSQRAGFEELCCQLAHHEPVTGVQSFTRKGAPDAGVECFWRLASGDEWGWQAKFFINGFGPVQWRECDESVKTALEKHPRLTRLYFCFPCDLPDARIKGQESTLARWEKRVQQWNDWAKTAQRTVEFIRWDEHELIRRLSDPINRGRLWFWFNAPALDRDWFIRAANTAAKQAHDRYSPELHFDLPLAERFDALARDEPFRRLLGAVTGELTEAIHRSQKFLLTSVLGASASALEGRIRAAVVQISALPPDIRSPIDFTAAVTAIKAAQDAADEAANQFWIERDNRVSEFQARNGRVPASSELSDQDYAVFTLREIDAVLRKAEKFLTSENAQLAHQGAMMLTGDAGYGKTHLFCSVAEARTDAGRPTVLLLGERFDGSEPWTNALQLVGVTCSRDEFLGALDAAGEAVGCRALILIDAINEGEGTGFWNKHLAAMLADLARFPHVGIAFSIRTSFLPQLATLPARAYVKVTHHGFAGQVAAATRHFFKKYGLAEPNVPVLNPEFENPLFLKLVCDALTYHGQPDIPADLRSITTLFGFILKNINLRLSSALDYDESENRVNRAVNRIAELMAQAGVEYLPIEIVKAELEKIHPSTGYSKSLLRHLIAEHLLARVSRSVGRGISENDIRFTYQKLSDHLIVRCLLDGKSREDSLQLFKTGPLARFGNEPYRLSEIAGWLEALAIQLPEASNLEIDEVVTEAFEDEAVSRAFIASLVWRKPAAFSQCTAQRIDAFLADTRRGDASAILDALVSVTACTDHPYNADWLDGQLRPLAMADRDASWSVYLFGKLDYESSIARLIEWAWAERASNSISDGVVRLGAQTLVWCLTTSDRFVRDRATKALVALIGGRVHLIESLLRQFSSVDEPYLQERLFAAAYGCVLRVSSATNFSQLAQYVYDRIFRVGTPPASVLLRDHARGIVDLAVRRGLALDYEPKKTVPPHQSSWPKAPPALDQLSVLFHHGTYDEKHAGLRRIYDSVIADDFNHYVVGDVRWWHSERLIGRSPAPREDYANLLTSVSEEDADILNFYAEQIARPFPFASNVDRDGLESKRRDYIASVDRMLPSMIGPERARSFLEKIVPYLKDTRNFCWNRQFDVKLFQRLILQRVLELGFTSERFNEIDRHVSSSGREAHKAERIGKKYQWIAYDEFHARISDNCGLADSQTSVMDENEWRLGTWPTSFRDLDPSLLLRATPRTSFEPSEVAWWTPLAHTEWNTENDPVAWLQRTSDLPSVESFLRCQQPDGSHWIMLNNYASWRRKEFAANDNYQENDRYEIHYIIRSYFVRRSHLKKIMAWGKQQNWINDLLPSPGHDYHRHLHEHYESVHFEGSIDDEWIEETFGHGKGDLPHPILPTTDEYMCEHKSYDCSIDETVIIYMPSRALVKMAGLKMNGRQGEFFDQAGRLIAFDPSTREPGANALAFCEDTLRQFLQKHDLALIWTLLSEKNIYASKHSSKNNGRMTLLGIYSWSGENVAGQFRTEFHAG